MWWIPLMALGVKGNVPKNVQSKIWTALRIIKGNVPNEGRKYSQKCFNKNIFWVRNNPFQANNTKGK